MTKKKKDKRITLTVDITDLVSKCKTPRNMEIWSKDKPMSKKCEKLIDECSLLVAYIGKRLNEGAEVKTNIIKRASIVKALVQSLLLQTCLDSFHRFGILDQIMYDLKVRKHQPIFLAVEGKSIEEKTGKGVNSRGYIR